METRPWISEPIPLEPTTPELMAVEQQLLAEVQERISALCADGWVIRNENTNRDRAAGTYRLWYTLERARR